MVLCTPSPSPSKRGGENEKLSMFLTVHGTAGALVGSLTGNPVSAFALGVLSHAVLDIIPHGDERLGDEKTGKEKLRFILTLGLIDSAILLVALLALLQPWEVWPSWSVLAGIAGGVIPDGFQLLHHLFPRVRWLERYQHIHDAFHLHVIRYDPPFAFGMAVQLLVLIAIVVAS